MKKIFFALFLMITYCFNAQAQSFEATVNRNRLPQGETFVLTLELKDVDTSQTPNIKDLSRDFTIMSVSNGYRTQVINSQITKSRQWNLVMIPNHSGELTIPAVTLGDYQTKPITIMVTNDNFDPVAAKSAAENDNNSSQFKIVGDIDNHHPYVQQQILYELKIYDTGGLRGDAPLFVGGGDDWVIKIFGEPEIKSRVVNGQHLREITYHYALFPQKSGNLTIPPVRFNGYYLVKSSRRDPFARFFDDEEFFAGFGLNDVFASQKSVTLATQPINLEVRPAAIDGGWWLPSPKVELTAKFDDDNPVFKVGEPVSRTIYLKAYGVLDSQLPEINFPDVPRVKQYPEKPVLNSYIENGQIVSSAQIRNVYIPQQQGELTLPEISVNWFNTTQNKVETAILPSYRAYATPTDNVEVVSTEPEVDIVSKTTPSAQESVARMETLPLNTRQIIWLLLAAFVGGIVLAGVIFKFFTYIRQKSVSPNYYKEVVSAARKGEIKALREALILWGKAKFTKTDITSLSDLSALINDEKFSESLNRVREYLYSSTPQTWQGDEFVQTFARIAKRKYKAQTKQNSILPKLYK